MAVIDDILGAVMIFFVVIIMVVFMMNKVIVRESSNVEMENKDFMQDYFSTALDTFLHFDENVTQRPFNILLGDYAYTGKYLLTTGEGTTDIKKASKKALDYIFGPGNYYMEIHPVVSDVYISFVFDGSDSLQDERQQVADSFSDFLSDVNDIFGDNSDVSVNVNIYILSKNSKIQMCNIFPTAPNLQCDVINFNELYSTYLTTITPPGFSAGSYASWKMTNPYASDNLFFEGDWMAGMVYAQQEYIKNQSLLEDEDKEGVSLHFMIPVSDELSTSSVSDACFDVNKANPTTYPFPPGDYNYCALCEDECPVDRSMREMDNITGTLANLGTIILPIFSFQCSFTYFSSWENFPVTTFSDNYVTPPIEGSICDENLCTGCQSGSNNNNYCWHTNCHDAIKVQMETLANNTGGRIIDVTDISGLAQSIVDQMNDSMQQFKLTLGIRDEERTRYVYTRNILLPSFQSTELNFWAYETPFIDKQPPIIMNLTITPHMGRNGTRFEIMAGIMDNSTLHNASIDVRKSSDGEVFSQKLNEHFLEYHYITFINSTGFEEDDYWVSVEAIDLFGNIGRANDMDFFRINDTDVTPPEITDTNIIPPKIKIDEWTIVYMNATDDISIALAKVNVTNPNGVTTVYEMELIEIEAGVYKFNFTITNTDIVGNYTIVYIVWDHGGNYDVEKGQDLQVKPDECAIDTICTEGWPAKQGSTFFINEPMYSCDVIEVCDEGIDYVVDEVEACCEANDCSGNKCSTSLCSTARSGSGVGTTPSENNILKCKAIYVIEGLGGYRRFKMREYFYEETCCSGISSLCSHCGSGYMGTCSCPNSGVPPLPSGFTCKNPTASYPEGWGSDTDMSKNSCIFSDMPSHVSFHILRTGTCVDYSLALTTLLRKIGMPPTDAYNIIGPGHAFNLIKLPGDTKWNIVDTTGSAPEPYVPNNIPQTSYGSQYCQYENQCMNDNGAVSCPAKSQVKGC